MVIKIVAFILTFIWVRLEMTCLFRKYEASMRKAGESRTQDHKYILVRGRVEDPFCRSLKLVFGLLGNGADSNGRPRESKGIGSSAAGILNAA